MPDRQLSELADAGSLHEPEVIEAQVRRMLVDPKSRALAEDFAGQWLRVGNLSELAEPDKRIFPEFTPELRDAMAEEAVTFCHAIFREDRPVLDLRMKQVREGEGTLLDHAMVLFGSALRDGNRHDPHDLPTVLAGRAGGTLSPGRHVVYGKDTPLCNLYVSMLARVGAPVERFADSTGPLPGLDNPEYESPSTS